MDMSDYTVLLHGPLAQKAPLLASLERAGCDLSDGQEHDQHWNRAYGDDPDPTVGWVRCRHSDVDHVVEVGSRAGWRLRAHWNTPDCGLCSGSGATPDQMVCRHCHGKGRTNRPAPTQEQLLRADLEQMRAEIAALKASRA